ncbi:unnamed protein product [Schistosoma mattheei]|uniref:Uncharacterized protein n=1 Tax=Schistosoma mattheei TaxID=31246 RepID=A0A183P638_9TREM|nr:unnamed protein product [Schistosoma mattheei]
MLISQKTPNLCFPDKSPTMNLSTQLNNPIIFNSNTMESHDKNNHADGDGDDDDDDDNDDDDEDEPKSFNIETCKSQFIFSRNRHSSNESNTTKAPISPFLSTLPNSSTAFRSPPHLLQPNINLQSSLPLLSPTSLPFPLPSVPPLTNSLFCKNSTSFYTTLMNQMDPDQLHVLIKMLNDTVTNSLLNNSSSNLSLPPTSISTAALATAALQSMFNSAMFNTESSVPMNLFNNKFDSVEHFDICNHVHNDLKNSFSSQDDYYHHYLRDQWDSRYCSKDYLNDPANWPDNINNNNNSGNNNNNVLLMMLMMMFMKRNVDSLISTPDQRNKSPTLTLSSASGPFTSPSSSSPSSTKGLTTMTTTTTTTTENQFMDDHILHCDKSSQHRYNLLHNPNYLNTGDGLQKSMKCNIVDDQENLKFKLNHLNIFPDNLTIRDIVSSTGSSKNTTMVNTTITTTTTTYNSSHNNNNTNNNDNGYQSSNSYIMNDLLENESDQIDSLVQRTELLDSDLWKHFHSMTTEMVITKSGR